MKPLVLASIEDNGGDRCVDILRLSDTEFGFSECRRDPEDSHGWRRLNGIVAGYPSEVDARKAAEDAVGWLKETAR